MTVTSQDMDVLRRTAVHETRMFGMPLSEREIQVLWRMAEGKNNEAIGRDLFVAASTVKTYAKQLFRKLGARDRAHAVAQAFRVGVLY
jgi:DNA-binding NarL/FixJ family response regulator